MAKIVLYLASKMKNKKLVPEVYARIQEDGEDCQTYEECELN